MKKYLIPISVALLITLAACGQPTEEVIPSAAVTPAPKPTETVTVTAAPTAEPAETSVPTPSPLPVEVTAALTPEPTPTPTPRPVSTPEPTVTPPPVQTPEPTQDPVTVLPPEVVLTPAPTPEPARPSDEEVLEAYRRANEAYGWFMKATLPAHQDDVREGEDGAVFHKVADERFPTLNDLRNYLKTLFSDEIVDTLLPADGQQYVDLDGALYVQEGGRGSDISKGALTLAVEWPQDGNESWCTVVGIVEILNIDDLQTVVGEETYRFPYQKVGDKWVFTQFESIF